MWQALLLDLVIISSCRQIKSMLKPAVNLLQTVLKVKTYACHITNVTGIWLPGLNDKAVWSNVH